MNLRSGATFFKGKMGQNWLHIRQSVMEESPPVENHRQISGHIRQVALLYHP